ncbi:MAG: sulfite exporter TauE/SafE family protein [Oscillospiraceae bacterium]|nr:sulfite exporter TauE/SafE family protein [Oscillospiraceae bacterium]
MITIYHFIIVCPLVFLAGFVDAVAGGGGLISLPAYMISGLPVHFAIGTNKLSSGMGTAVATAKFAKSGFINWKTAAICAVCALIASNMGARIALMISDAVFKKLLLVILPLTAFYIFKSKSLDMPTNAYSYRKTLLIAIAAALAIGLYDGFYGPGTGTFLILLLTGAAHMKLNEANGISKVINLATNISSLSVMFMNGKVLLGLGLVAGIFGMAGNYLGTRFFEKGGAKFAKPMIVLVLTIFFVKIVTEMI